MITNDYNRKLRKWLPIFFGNHLQQYLFLCYNNSNGCYHSYSLFESGKLSSKH